MPWPASTTEPGPWTVTDNWYCVTAACTSIANAGRDAVVTPSLTLIRMSTYSPTLLGPGMPERRPVDELKAAHGGRLTIVAVSVSPSLSEILGWNEYFWPVIAESGGTPDIVGAVLVVGGLQIFADCLRSQLGCLASASEAKPSDAIRKRTSPAVDACLYMSWRPRCLCRLSRQTGSFASPPRGGFALFHCDHDYSPQRGHEQVTQLRMKGTGVTLSARAGRDRPHNWTERTGVSLGGVSRPSRSGPHAQKRG